jgi:hypothetical protein
MDISMIKNTLIMHNDYKELKIINEFVTMPV